MSTKVTITPATFVDGLYPTKFLIAMGVQGLHEVEETHVFVHQAADGNAYLHPWPNSRKMPQLPIPVLHFSWTQIRQK